ncbi:MAG: glycoside hydrolase family 127 protein [Bacteroidales bacterium]|nr:glycoside hydrolase family 127 protein [Candidatus Liminaster caballi]
MKYLIASLLACLAVGSYAQEQLYPNEFPLSDVTLLDGPLKHAQDVNVHTLLRYDVDRLLAPFRKEAGLKEVAPLFPNWAGLDGHVGGHYLSAMAMYAALGNKECEDRMLYMIAQLKECADAAARNYPDWAKGYIGGVPGSDRVFSEYKKGNVGPFMGLWVPFYNTHKIQAGLRDAWLYCGNEDARELFIGTCDWMISISSNLTDEQVEKMLGMEHGGINEVLADAYQMTGDRKYLDAAKRYSHKWLLRPMKEHNGQHLDNIHANTQVPKVVGFARVAELSGDADYLEASRFFWDEVVNRRSLSLGGNSRREHFPSKESCIDWTQDIDGLESCNTNNMLKLTEDLFRMDPDNASMADYYERATFNHILSTQHPEHGGYVYFTSARPRHYRNYSVPNEAMWCCVGTGMENHGKYGQFIYTKSLRTGEKGSVDTLSVILYAASELRWKERGIVVSQQTQFPYGETSRLTIASGKGEFAVRLRKPAWCSHFKVSVNGKLDVESQSDKADFVTIQRKWKKGDVIDVEFPMHASIEHMPNVPQYVAILYGPVTLAMKTGNEDLRGLLADDSRFGQMASGRKLPVDQAPYLVANNVEDIANDLVPVPGKPLHFTLRTRMENAPQLDASQDVTGELIPFFELHDSRYMLYWLALSADGYKEYLDKLAAEEKERLALDARTTDKVQPGEQQPESDHFMEITGKSNTGVTNSVAFRDARDGGSFSYLMQTGGERNLSLRVRYWGQDEWRTCEYDLYIDDNLVREVNNSRKWRSSQWKYETYEIPASVLEGKQQVRVRFVAKPHRQVGEIYEVRLVK